MRFNKKGYKQTNAARSKIMRHCVGSRRIKTVPVLTGCFKHPKPPCEQGGNKPELLLRII
jgi:hypothetical protein